MGALKVLYVLPEFGDRARTRDHGDDRGMRQRKLQGSSGKCHPVTVTDRLNLPYPLTNVLRRRGVVVIGPAHRSRGEDA